MQFIDIDGSVFEGGGSIVRFALAMSATTSKPVKIKNIRENRPVPGLKVQHLEAARALAKLCNARLAGDRVGSRELIFAPSEISSRNLDINLSTAASIGLVFQALKIPASLGDSDIKIHIKGGATAGLWSPPVRYIQNITLPLLSKTGYIATAKIVKEGFYPAGGAEVLFDIKQWNERRGICLVERGRAIILKIVSVASSHLKKSHVAERQAFSAKEVLSKLGLETDIEIIYVNSISPGSVIVLWIETDNAVIGSDAIGKKGTPSEEIGKFAAMQLIDDFRTGACIDRYMTDQIIAHMALCNEKSSVSVPLITGHARANMSVVERFLPVTFKTKKHHNHFIVECLQKS